MRTSTKIVLIAVAAEAILIATGLALAAVQGLAALESHGELALAASAAAFPLLLAALELFKIPAGWSLYHARWVMKPFAALLLAGGMVATFETVTMAGSTWFRSLQFEITAAQSDLDAMRELRAGTAAPASQSDEIAAALDALDRQIAVASEAPEVAAAASRLDDLTAEIESLFARRADVRAGFAADWDAQTDNNNARMESGNPAVAEQAKASQRSMPTRIAYVDARMAEWEATEGMLLETRVSELEMEREAARQDLDAARRSAAADAKQSLEALRAERSQLQEDLMATLDEERQRQSAAIDLGAEIEKQQQRVAALASKSVIYDIAAKAFGVPIHEVPEEQANIVTFWVILGVGLAAALSTGLAAFVAAHVGRPIRSPAHRRALRAIATRKRDIAERDRAVAALEARLREKPKVEHRERIVYRYLPIDRELAGEVPTGQLKSITGEAAHAA